MTKHNSALADEKINALLKIKELVEIGYKRKNKFKSPAFEAIHRAASGLLSVDAIPQEAMHNFDKACLDSVDDLQPLEIKVLREELNVSHPRLRPQSTKATILSTSKKKHS